MIDIDEFREYLIINKHDLDTEVSRQPTLFETVGDAYAEAVAERDTLKHALETIDAKLDIAIRKASDKITEGAIRSQIQAHKDHLNAFKSYLDSKERADKLGALKESFNQRSYMLRELCGLFVSNYFESTATQGTAQTDRAVYAKTRQRLAEGRRKGRND